MDLMSVVLLGGGLLLGTPLFGYSCFASYRAGHSDGLVGGYDAWIVTRSLHPFKFFYVRGYREGEEEREVNRAFTEMYRNILGY